MAVTPEEIKEAREKLAGGNTQTANPQSVQVTPDLVAALRQAIKNTPYTPPAPVKEPEVQMGPLERNDDSTSRVTQHMRNMYAALLGMTETEEESTPYAAAPSTYEALGLTPPDKYKPADDAYYKIGLVPNNAYVEMGLDLMTPWNQPEVIEAPKPKTDVGDAINYLATRVVGGAVGGYLNPVTGLETAVRGVAGNTDYYSKLDAYFEQNPAVLQALYAGKRVSTQDVQKVTGANESTIEAYMRARNTELQRQAADNMYGSTLSDNFKNRAGGVAESLGLMVPSMLTSWALPTSTVVDAIGTKTQFTKALARAISRGRGGIIKSAARTAGVARRAGLPAIQGVLRGAANGAIAAAAGNPGLWLMNMSVAGQTLAESAIDHPLEVGDYINAMAQGFIEQFTEGMLGYTDAKSLELLKQATGSRLTNIGRALLTYLINGSEEALEEIINVPLSATAEMLTGQREAKLFGTGGIFDVKQMAESGISGLAISMIMGGAGGLVSIASTWRETGDNAKYGEALNNAISNIPEAYRPAPLKPSQMTETGLKAYERVVASAMQEWMNAEMVKASANKPAAAAEPAYPDPGEPLVAPQPAGDTLTPAQAQSVNKMILNIKADAQRAGVSLDAYNKATEGLDTASMNRQDINAIVEALRPVVEATGNDINKTYLDKMASYAAPQSSAQPAARAAGTITPEDIAAARKGLARSQDSTLPTEATTDIPAGENAAAQTTERKVMDSGEEAGNEDSNGSGERTVGVDTAESGSGVESRAGEVESGRPRGTQKAEAARIRAAVEAEGTLAQSTESFGLENGTQEAVVKAASDSTLTDSMRALKREMADKGIELSYFTDGFLELYDEKEYADYKAGNRKLEDVSIYHARGAVSFSKDGNIRMWIKADHERYTYEQLVKHEEYHVAKEQDPGLLDRLLSDFLKKHDSKGKALSYLSAAYARMYFTDSEGNTTVSAEYIMDEIFADMNAGIDVLEDYVGSPYRATDYTADVRAELEGRNVTERGPPIGEDDESRFSREDIERVITHFGTTRNWNETGYITTDGSRLDFSGRSEGNVGKGGTRTIDHRDIWETYTRENSDMSGTDAMIAFMAEGNIRVLSETSGINLSVKPTPEQETALRSYISRIPRRGIYVDIDTTGGQTIHSWEYPYNTTADQVIEDLRAYFDEGVVPEPDTDTRYSREDSEGNKLTPEQVEFFADSKVRDADGNLLVVYHGSPNEFTVFDKEKLGKRGSFPSSELGFYFTEERQYAEVMGNSSEGKNIYQAYLNIKSPLRIFSTELPYSEQVDKVRKMLAEGDYDGIIDDMGNYVAFSPEQIKSIDNKRPTADPDIRYSREDRETRDREYLDAINADDMETAQRMVDEAAGAAGYASDTSWKLQHTAPNAAEDVALDKIKQSGIVPDDYWSKPQWYQSAPEEWESFYKVRKAMELTEKYASEGKIVSGKPKVAGIWVYRAVDKTKNTKEDYFRNGDWVTPSYAYAANEGRMNPEGYRIIKHHVPISNLYWDGNSIAELGYDDGKAYVYADTKNNRKLLDPVTYDEYGRVIPLSKRFKKRVDDIRYSREVTDEETLDFLNAQLERGEVVEVYRAMQRVNGALYPPMAGTINGEWQNPSKLKAWEVSEEITDFDAAVKSGLLIEYKSKNGKTLYKFNLTKGETEDFDGGTAVAAAYAPYIHTSLSMLNDQFTSAYKRANLVVVRGYVPKSELNSAYRAPGSEKSTGETKWHSGVVAAQMPDTRRVILSRYFYPVEALGDDVVAKGIKAEMKGKDIEIPYNVVSPGLRRALETEGVRIGEGRGIRNLPPKDSVRYSREDSEGNKLTPEQVEFFKDSKVRDADGKLLVVYHGTNANFDVFRTADGSYFTDSKKIATGFSYGKRLVSAYLNIRNPFALDAKGTYYDSLEAPEEMNKTNAKYNMTPEEKKIFERFAPLRAEHQELVENEAPVKEIKEWESNHPEFFELFPDVQSIVQRKAAFDEKNSSIIASWELVEWVQTQKKYDGVIIKNVREGWSSEIVANDYIPLSPEQIKSVDNRNPTENPDIRYSREEESLNDLRSQNERLQELVDYWKGQTKRTEKVTTRRADVEKTARDLISGTSSTMAVSDVAGALQQLYDYIAQGGDAKDELTWTGVKRRALSIASDLVRNAEALVNEESAQTARDIRKHLKGMRLSISRADAGDFDNFAEFRKSNFGTFTVAISDKGQVVGQTGGEADATRTPVDVAYPELTETFGEDLFPSSIAHPADQLRQIADVVRSLMPLYENPYSFNLAEAAEYTANEIIESFYDTRQTAPTFADRQAAKLTEQQIKDKKQFDKLREEKNAQIAKLRAEWKARVAQAIKMERARRIDQVEALKDHYRTKEANARESRNARALRAKIVRHVNDLSQKLLKPTDKRHVPESLRTAVAAVLESINLESNYTVDAETGKRAEGGDGSPTKRTEAFRKLKAEYSRLLKAGDALVIDPDLIGDAENPGNLDVVISMADIRLTDMNTQQLDIVWQTIRAVEASIANANKMLGKSRFANVSDMAEAIREDTAKRKTKTERMGLRGWLGRVLSTEMLKPVDYFHRLGNAGESLWRELREAQDTFTRRIAQAQTDIEKMFGGADVKEWGGKDAPMTKFKLESGETLELTPAQAMGLYLLAKRPQALEHILIGGVRQGETERKGRKVARGTEPVKITVVDIGKIAASLTAEQTRVADEIGKYASTTLSDWGNEASMAVYGYKKFTEDNYWPIKSDPSYLRTESGKGVDVTIKGRGFTKQTVQHASNAIIINDALDTFAQHVNDMATYSAWLAAIEDAERVMNFRFRTETGDVKGSVKETISRAFGNAGLNYFDLLVEDINQGVKTRTDASTMSALTANYKAAAVGANLRVVVQQPTSILRAAALIDTKYLIAGSLRKGNWKLVKKWAPIAQWKDWGYFDIETGRQMKDVLLGTDSAMAKTRELAMAAAAKADSITWSKIWNACEAEVRDKRQTLKRGSDEYYKAVAERFNEIIDRSQVVDGILQRNQIMRSTSDIARMASSFMSEPVTTYSMFASALDDFINADAETRKTAGKRLARTALAVVLADVLCSALASFVDALRDDDKEQNYWQKWIEAFVGLSGDEESFGDYLKGLISGNLVSQVNPMAKIPFVKDILSLLSGYDITRMDMDAFSKLIESAQRAIKALSGKGTATIGVAIADLTASVARVFGVPIYSIKRDLTAVIDSALQASGNWEMMYRADKLLYAVGSTANKGRYYDLLFYAWQEEDKTQYNAIRRDMRYHGYDPNNMDDAIKDRLKKTEEFTTAAGEVKDEIVSSITRKSAYNALPAEYKEKALESAEDYATAKTMLDQNPDYTLPDAYAWIEKADGGADVGVDPWEYILFRTAISKLEDERAEEKEALPEGEELEEDFQDQFIAILDGMDLTDDEWNYLFHTRYESDENNPRRWW